MILNLYGNDGLIFNALATGFTEAHLKDSFKFDVVKVDDVGSKFKEAVKKEYSAKFLDDSDMVIRFAIPQQNQMDEEEPEEEETEETSEEEKTEETSEEGDDTEEETPAEEEETTEEPAEEEKSDEEDEEDDKKKQTLKEANQIETDMTNKIIKTIKRCLFIADTENVELSDLNDFIEGYRVAFVKVSLTEKTQTPS